MQNGFIENILPEGKAKLAEWCSFPNKDSLPAKHYIELYSEAINKDCFANLSVKRSLPWERKAEIVSLFM